MHLVSVEYLIHGCSLCVTCQYEADGGSQQPLMSQDTKATAPGMHCTLPLNVVGSVAEQRFIVEFDTSKLYN